MLAFGPVPAFPVWRVSGGCVGWGVRIRRAGLSTVDVDDACVCGAVGRHFGDTAVRWWLRITCYHYQVDQ